MTSSTLMARPWPVSRPMYPVRTARISAIARTAFWLIYLLSLTNIMAVVMRYLSAQAGSELEFGIYPVTFSICAALVLMFTKGQHHSPILVVSWIFWGIYTVGGFAGEYQLTGTYFRFVLEVVIKPWMTIVGLPWLALRAISQERAPRLIQATVLIMAAGSVLALCQVIMPGFMELLLMDPGRGAGFLINPNHFGFTAACTLFLSFIYPFERRWLNQVLRMLLFIGLAATLSRSAYLAVFAGWVVYGVAAKRFTALFNSLIVMVVFIGGLLFAFEVMEAVSPRQAERFDVTRSFLRGDFVTEESDNRTGLWQATMQIIVEREGVVQGLGHGSMERIVPVGPGLSPHNYYLFVWGNSGIVAVVALLAFHFILFQQAFTCRQANVRAALLALATVFAVAHIFDHSLIGRPFPGAILACIVIAVAYGRRVNGLVRTPQRTGYPSIRPGALPAAR